MSDPAVSGSESLALTAKAFQSHRGLLKQRKDEMTKHQWALHRMDAQALIRQVVEDARKRGFWYEAEISGPNTFSLKPKRLAKVRAA